MTSKTLLLACHAIVASLLALTQSAAAQSPAPAKAPVEIKKVEYKELKDGKHQILVSWDLFEGGGGVGSTAKNALEVTKINLEIELTDARGAKQKITKTLTAGSGEASFTPVPIPKNPIVAVPVTDIFRGNLNPLPENLSVIKFKVALTATGVVREGIRSTVTGVARKEGSLQVKR